MVLHIDRHGDRIRFRELSGATGATSAPANTAAMLFGVDD
jgi:hypothetical protein